jgi:two-component system, cell cycle response regulator DivK
MPSGATLPLILLADDTEDNRDLYGTVLSLAGWRVEYAENGREAVDKARSAQPAVVVMDLGMPVMDGWQATRVIKAEPETKHIPVIALSGHVTTEARMRALAAGAAAFCSKPCDPAALVDAVRQLLPDTL